MGKAEPGSRGFIRDQDCTRDTPVIYGREETPIYGKGVRIRPRIPGRTDSEYKKRIYLQELFPLEEYDRVIVLLSGGKDSIASYYKLVELGVPKEKMELWHHDIDGGHPARRMDWRCTGDYVKAFAQAEGVPLRVSWRVNGFFGELYRIGASMPVRWREPGSGEEKSCRPSPAYRKCQDIRREAGEDMGERLRQFGYRMKFPMKTGDLSRRWCSAYLKVMVADTVMSNLGHLGLLERRGKETRILVASGERRGESPGRSKYNEMEIHRTNAEKRGGRIVHQWRPVIDYSEKDVWEVLKRHRVAPHPCYRAGWNRCSCAMCIFSIPRMFAGIRELYPEEFCLLEQDEEALGFTLDNRCSLGAFVGDAASCVYHGDRKALDSLLTGKFPAEDIYVAGRWRYPAGAFHGTEGGPC